MPSATCFDAGGYVLAGGRSSRMGTDKALLQLAGKPLVERAVAKLHGLCADVHILSSNSALAAYAPLVGDVHPGRGPIGGMESALLHSSHDWNVLLAVDMPFLPASFIRDWVSDWMTTKDDAACVRMFTADGRLQPGFCLLHRDLAPFLSKAICDGEFKLMSALESASRDLALRRGSPTESAIWKAPATRMPRTLAIRGFEAEWSASSARVAGQPLWFVNLNSPEELAEMQQNVCLLESCP